MSTTFFPRDVSCVPVEPYNSTVEPFRLEWGIEMGHNAATMAKKRNSTPDGHDKKKDRHRGIYTPVRLTPGLKAAIVAYAEKERRSVNQSVALLLEEILTQKGLYQP